MAQLRQRHGHGRAHTLTLPTELRADREALALWLTTVRDRAFLPAEPVDVQHDDVTEEDDDVVDGVPVEDDHRRFMPPGA